MAMSLLHPWSAATARRLRTRALAPFTALPALLALLALAALVALVAAPAGPAAAQTAGAVDSADTDPAFEKRVWDIAVELRCLVCQNQTIADSNADLAVDLRNQVRAMLKQGKSQREIIDYMTARYGDFVLYRPPVKQTTWLLWFGPGLLLLGGVGTLGWVLRQRSRLPADRFEPDLSDDLDAGDAASGSRAPGAASPSPR
jgi:cytochrome c-type biogenesis protein CcmH